MNLLLRIIDQTQSESEQSRTIPLGENGYHVTTRVNNGITQANKSLFEIAVDQFFVGVPCTEEERQNVRAVIQGETRPYIVKNHEVAYIVNSEGRTVERICGHYVKY